MLLITHPLPSDSQTALPFSSCCCDSCKLDIKSLAGVDYDLCPTIKIGRLIYILSSFLLVKVTLRVSTNLKPFVLFSTVPNSLVIANLVFCNWIRASLLLFYDISDECVKLWRALRFWFILVLWAGTGCRFFVLGAGIGLYGGIGLSSKYCSNCRTFLLGVGIGILLLGAGIGCAFPHLLGQGIGQFASSLILTRFWSSLILIPDNSLLINSLRLLIILLVLYVIFFLAYAYL